MITFLFNKAEQERNRGSISRAILQYAQKTLDISEANTLKSGDIAIFFSGGAEIRNIAPALEKIPKGVITAWYLCDMRTVPELPKTNAKFDYIFNPYFNVLESLKLLTKKRSNTFFMPQIGFAYSPGDFTPPVKKDIMFFGNPFSTNKWHLNRPAILKEIKKHFKLHLIHGEIGHSTSQTHFYKNYPLSLSILPPNSNGASNRMYNIMAAKGCVLTNYEPFLKRMFKNTKDILWFVDNSQIEGIIKFYLENPDEIETIKRNSFELFEKYYRGDKIIADMEDIINGKIKEFKGLIYE